MPFMEKAFTLWFTGLPGSGKTTLSRLIEDRLRALGEKVEVLDGDEIRTGLCQDLGFSKADRDENIRRIGLVSELLSRNGIVAIVAAVSPYRAARNKVRSHTSRFVEIHVACPLPVLKERDPKGLYRRAASGQLAHLTGIDDPYEPPEAPEIVVDTSRQTVAESAEDIWAALEELGLIPARKCRSVEPVFSKTATRPPESQPCPSGPDPGA